MASNVMQAETELDREALDAGMRTYEGDGLDWRRMTDDFSMFTLVAVKSGKHLTYRMDPVFDEDTGKQIYELLWVSVLVKGDTWISLGRLNRDVEPITVRGREIKPNSLALNKKGPFLPTSTVVLAFMYFKQYLGAGQDVPGGIVYHAGRCCCCGRPLTNPESIKSGIGPICAKKYHF